MTVRFPELISVLALIFLFLVVGCTDAPLPDQVATDTTASGSAQVEPTVVTEADEAENKMMPEPPQTDFEAYLSDYLQF